MIVAFVANAVSLLKRGFVEHGAAGRALLEYALWHIVLFLIGRLKLSAFKDRHRCVTVKGFECSRCQ